MRTSWLDAFLTAYLEDLRPDAAEFCVRKMVKPYTRDRKTAAKRWLLWSLHRRGLAYGLPLARPDVLGRVEGGDWVESFGPVLAIWLDLVLEVEAIWDPPQPLHSRSWLLCCLALLVEHDDLARELFAQAQGSREDRRVQARAVKAVESRLATRRYAVSNPLLGLSLRNGFVFADARLLGRLAISVLAHEGVDNDAVQRLRQFFWRERRLLVGAMCALASGGDGLKAGARKIAASQLAETGLSRIQVKELRALLDAPPSAEELAAEIAGRRGASYLIEQVVLAAVIDGYLDDDERAFIDHLAQQLGVPPAQLSRIGDRVTRFVEHHRDLFDLFTETKYYGRLTRLVQERVVGLVQRNLDALVTEIRQTGELATLLTRAAAGQKLDIHERRRVREQLLDIVRAAPSLALFALPGGALLLPIVLRLLPWDLRPSAFRDEASKKSPR